MGIWAFHNSEDQCVYLTVAVRRLFGCFPRGGIHGIILKILHPDSSVSTRSITLTETEKKGGSNLGSLYLEREETDLESGSTILDR